MIQRREQRLARAATIGPHSLSTTKFAAATGVGTVPGVGPTMLFATFVQIENLAIN
jgi:hypothetical protein